MKCKKCRKQIPDGSKFCNHCGTPVSDKKKLYRRPDGLYEKVLIINGKRVAFRAKKEADVYKKIREYEEKKENGPLFPDVAEQWHTEHWESLSPTTQKGYQCAFNEIKEHFSGVFLNRIMPKDINSYIKALPKSYARKTCVTRLQLLGMIFKYAISEGLCESNPCEYISVPKGHGSKKRRAPTSDEIDVIKKSIGVEYKSFPVGFLAVFLLYTGCRKGEALALTYKDIDRKNKRITINKAIYFEHNEGKIKKPKTEAGIREIIIPDHLLPLIPKGNPSRLVFSPTSDEYMRDHFFRSAWTHWQKQTGLDLTAHQLRHGYATLLHEADIDVKDAQELLGHADAGTTQNIYTEVSARRKTKVAEKINLYLQ